MNKIKGCTGYPTKLVAKAATGGIMTKPQPTSMTGVQPYAMPAQPTNTLAQQRAQLAKDNYASMASDYMARAQARRSAPAVAPAPYQKTDIAGLRAKYGLDQAPAPAARPMTAKPVARSGPLQGSAASRNTKYDTYSTKADTAARAKSYGPPTRQQAGYSGVKDMFDGGGPRASSNKSGAKKK